MSVVGVLIVKNQECITVASEFIAVLYGLVVCLHHEVVATESSCFHEQCGVWMIEVGYHTVGESEVVGREDEFVCPPYAL